jgi:hypothetical protein
MSLSDRRIRTGTTTVHESSVWALEACFAGSAHVSMDTGSFAMSNNYQRVLYAGENDKLWYSNETSRHVLATS